MVQTSVIIPAFNEEDAISGTLQNVVDSFADDPNIEVIVVDGGSRDRTASKARAAGATVLSSPRGRAKQMNAGAARATAEVFIFLHADSRLPPRAGFHIHSTLEDRRVAAGAFHVKIGDITNPASVQHLGLRVITWFANLRSRYWSKPYGDQAIFMTRKVFNTVGGYRDIPIMEDYDMVIRLARIGRVALVRDPKAVCVTSARRWTDVGFFRTTVLNWAVVLGFHIGIPITSLASWYRDAAARPLANRKPQPYRVVQAPN